jgi:recombination protein RecT
MARPPSTEVAPVGAPPQERMPVNTWEGFASELSRREREITPLLPSNIPWERFKNTAVAAVKQTPEILEATPRTLFAALTKAAGDGLLPDGREGFINVYNVKVQRRRPGSNATEAGYEKQAAWAPMLYGLRKRARELGDIIIDAQAVYKGDVFVWRQGDAPLIDHQPAPLGTERGPLIGAYAIFRDKDGTILHREVMDKAQIEVTRGQSRASDSLMWSKFPEEAYRKTVVRRGVKTVPVSEKLEQIIRRDDEAFAWGDRPTVEGGTSAERIPATPARALAGPPKAPPPQGNGGGVHGAPAAVDQRAGDAGPAEVGRDAAERQDAGANRPDDQGRAGDAVGVDAEGRPPGVNAAGQVADYAAFAEWVQDTLVVCPDASALFEAWQAIVTAWQQRMPPDWFTTLAKIPPAILAEWQAGDAPRDG